MAVSTRDLRLTLVPVCDCHSPFGGARGVHDAEGVLDGFFPPFDNDGAGAGPALAGEPGYSALRVLEMTTQQLNQFAVISIAACWGAVALAWLLGEIAERACTDIRRWSEPGRRGHFMPLEEPGLLADELRHFVASLRL